MHSSFFSICLNTMWSRTIDLSGKQESQMQLTPRVRHWPRKSDYSDHFRPRGCLLSCDLVGCNQPTQFLFSFSNFCCSSIPAANSHWVFQTSSGRLLKEIVSATTPYFWRLTHIFDSNLLLMRYYNERNTTCWLSTLSFFPHVFIGWGPLPCGENMRI